MLLSLQTLRLPDTCDRIALYSSPYQGLPGEFWRLPERDI